MRRSFVISLAIAFVAFASLFALEWFLEWHRLGEPGEAARNWQGVNNAKLVDILSPMARAYNNVLAMLLATIGLAIPLTANMHTPKLIDVFLRDGINRAVLGFMAFGAAHVLWVDYIIGPEFAPMWAIHVAVFTAIAGWAILIPYFFYVVRFLDPSRVIHRLTKEIERIVEDVGRGKREPVQAQADAAERIDQIGTIILKSLERADRGVAKEGVWELKELLDHYAVHKKRLPPAWFHVDRADFAGLSEEALVMLSENRTWYGMKVMSQMSLAFQHALTKASDVISAVSDANRVVGVRAAERGDHEVAKLSIRFFNNFLRESIKARNVHAIYDVFHQYRVMAKDLTAHPDLLRDIGKHFDYYAGMARSFGMGFAPQLAVFDLGYVVRRAYEAESEAASDLLDQVLGLPHRTGHDVHSMAVKAKLNLGGFFVETGRDAEAKRVAANLADVDALEVATAQRQILEAERCFHEVTDHQVNIEYVPPERREPLRRFCTMLAGTGDATR